MTGADKAVDRLNAHMARRKKRRFDRARSKGFIQAQGETSVAQAFRRARRGTA